MPADGRSWLWVRVQTTCIRALNAGGRQVVVVGTGADDVYPSSAGRLIDRSLLQGGCVLSLEPWGTQPLKWAFPKRTQVIAALSGATFVAEAGMPSGTFSTAEAANALGRELLAAPGSIFSPESRGANYLIAATFVAEAGMPSGTFSTAEAANALGRELLAAPGSIFSPESRGANYLIANGACCIADEEALEIAISRIYGTLRFSRPEARGLDGLNPNGRRMVDMLLANPMRVDDLAAALGVDPLACLQLIGDLEVHGVVELDPLACLQLIGDLEVHGVVERLVDGRLALSGIALHALTRLGQNG